MEYAEKYNFVIYEAWNSFYNLNKWRYGEKKSLMCPHRGIAINTASPNPLKLEGKKNNIISPSFDTTLKAALKMGGY